MDYDATALRITARIRSSLDLEDVLQFTVDELGRTTGASRSLIQLAPGADGVALLMEWDRGDTHPLGVQPPTPIARRVFELGERVVIGEPADAPEDIRAYLERVGSVSAVALLVRFQSDVLAVLGFQDSTPRDWHETVVPFLERIEGQIGAALAQASLYAHQQAALEQMRNLDRMREELLANVSHELRTPLSAIIGSIKTLRHRDGDLSSEQRRDMLAVADEQAERLTALTEDILELSRFTRGRRLLSKSTVRLVNVLERAKAGIEVPADREIDVELVGDPVLVADLNRLVQVFTNLLENGVRHGRGRVTVRGGQKGPVVVLHVSDEGDGVPVGYRKEMFAPFSHASDRTDSTGLGLSIARAIIEAHGGTLTYSPAAGSAAHAFVVTLPGETSSAE